MAKGSSIYDLDSGTPRWFAVQTRSKSEKFVVRMLHKKGITCYLPLMKIMRKYSRSKRLVEKPLINCYVFVYITREHYLPVLETENVSGFVKFNRDLVAIPEEEMATIRRVSLEEDLDVQTIAGQISSGDHVEIAAGTLTGLKGKVIKQEGKQQFQIELASLGMSLLISVNAAFLEKIPRGSSDWMGFQN